MLTEPPVVLIGAGGHAKVVLATLRDQGRPVAAALDDNQARWGQTVRGVPIDGPLAKAAEMGHPAIIAIGSNAVRKRLAEQYPTLEWANVIHPSAHLDGTVTVGPGSVVFAGAVIQPDTLIGAHVIVNTGATVDHDCRLADYVHTAPGTHLAGGVTLEEGAFLGISSAAIPGVTVGAWATVGAGGVVINDIPPNVTAVGVPARPLKGDR